MLFIMPPVSESAVFLDLDGVVLDVSLRYHAVHEEISRQLGGASRDLDDYWTLKRENASVEELTGLSSDGAREYKRRWSQLIEAPAFLELDRYLPQARTAVILLAASYSVVAVALRRKSDALREQLRALSFPKVAQICAAPPKGDAALSKARLIQGSPFFSKNAVLVGDTEADIRAGREVGLTTVAVRGGLGTDDVLANEDPDLLLDGIAELPAALKRLFVGGRP
jgi:phosphoglycolate phosphatase